MSTEFFIACRYLLAKRKGLFSMITTVIGVAGVGLGVAALIITLAIMNGFQTDIKEKLIDAQSHVSVYGALTDTETGALDGLFEKDPLFKAKSSFVLGQAILTAGGRSTGVVVKGFDPRDEFKVNSMKTFLTHGSWDELYGKKDKSAAPVLAIGEELAWNINVWVGDYVVLVSPQEAVSGMGMLPKMKKFKVVALIKTGYYEFDNTMAYTSLDGARDFFGKNVVPGYSIRLNDIKKAPAAAELLRKALPGRSVKTYEDMNKTLYSALKLEKFVMSMVLALIILVATFNIASNLLMMSVEKLRDIGILRSMGAGPGFVRKVFLWEGNLIAVTGIIGGVVLGTFVCWFLATYPVIQLPSDIYYITKVPVDIRWQDILGTALASYALCMVSTIYPAVRASKISPVDAVRYG